MADTDCLRELLGDDAVDLGHGHWAKFFVRDGVRTGFFHVHPAAGGDHTPEGEPCAGAVNFDVPANTDRSPGRAVWQLLSADPLHVEPSILCSCGRHGFVRGGRWEEC